MCFMFPCKQHYLSQWGHMTHMWNDTKAEMHLVSRRLVMYREQRSDDDVTRYVRNNSPFVGLGRISLPWSRPDRQDQQQTEHHPGPLWSKRGSWSGVCHDESSQETTNLRNSSPGHGRSLWTGNNVLHGLFPWEKAKVVPSLQLLRFMQQWWFVEKLNKNRS